MADQKSRLQILDTDDVKRVRFRDRHILDETLIQQIADEISLVIDQATEPKILLDFTGVEHLSSAALGAMITINNKVRAKAGQLRLVNIDKQIYEVFVITKLSDLFQIHTDEQKAMSSFS